MLQSVKNWVKRYVPGATVVWRRLTWPHPRRVFRHIYHANRWGDDESRSGTGSNLAQTEKLRTELPLLLRRLGCKTLLDLPCGDFWWMNLADLDGIEYIGGDIVPELIAENRQRFARPGRRFEVLDLASNPLPRADVVFCRDCLVHLSYEFIDKALANLHRSGATYLVTTTYPATPANMDIPSGHWRTLNLTLPPFFFPPPLEALVEGCTEGEGAHVDKSLGVWRLADLPQRLRLAGS